jgi:hypothetical protein
MYSLAFGATAIPSHSQIARTFSVPAMSTNPALSSWIAATCSW